MVSESVLIEKVEPFIEKFSYEYNSNRSLSEELFFEMPVSTFLFNEYKNAYYDPDENGTVFTQIFAICGVLEDKKNPYYQMMKQIEEEYGLDRDIVEVGGGIVPALAIEIAKRQKEIGKGSITVYDPNSIIPIDGAKVIKREFTLATPLRKNDLIVGRKPCQITPTMIQSANKNNIEFYISLCNCNHTPKEYQLTHQGVKGNIWYNYLEDLARDTLPSGFSFEREEEKSVINNTKVIVMKTKRMK